MRRLPLLVVAALAVIGGVAPTTLAAPSAPAATVAGYATIGSGSCDAITYVDPCTSASGTVGAGSCNADRACKNSFGDIGDNACNGSSACEWSSVNVADESCNGYYACYEDQGSIGESSCNGQYACYLNGGTPPLIGDHSCNGLWACWIRSVGSYSCTGDNACPLGGPSVVGDCQNNAVTPEPCKPCPLGFWSGNGIGYPSACAPADPGHYVDTTAATSQTSCVPGYYQPSSGQTSCLAADVGYHVDTTGADHQTACPAGQTTAATASTSASACFTPYVSPYARKQSAAAELQALLPTGSSASDNRLTKGIADINSSLASWRWTAADALNPVFGWRVFNFERHAITWLWAGPLLSNPTLSAVANNAVNQLVAADREIVVKAIANSTDSAAIAKANAKLAQADALIALQQRAAAIYKLRAAWLAVN